MPRQRDHVTYMGGPKRSNIYTPLGSLLHEKGITAKMLMIGTGIHPRTLSNYLGNKIPILPSHLPLITEFLGCTVERIMQEPEGGWEGNVEKIRQDHPRPQHHGMVRDMMRPKDANEEG